MIREFIKKNPHKDNIIRTIPGYDIKGFDLLGSPTIQNYQIVDNDVIVTYTWYGITMEYENFFKGLLTLDIIINNDFFK